MSERRVPMAFRTRPWTAERRNPDGSRTLRVKRVCNGCTVVLGDATRAELDRSIDGLGLPDVRGECPYCSTGGRPPVAETRCDVTELLVEQCAHCRKTPDLPRPVEDYGPWFEARFPGRCTQCQEKTLEGDTIRADGVGGYLCHECGGA